MAQKLKEPGIEWLYEERDIDDLIPWEHNPRIIYEDVYHKLVKSFEDSGDFGVFVVNHEGMLIAGHQRKRALKEFNVKKVLVKYPSRPITDLEFQRVNLADNKLTASFDHDLLSNVFDESVVGDFFDPKEIGGYDPKEAEQLVSGSEEEEEKFDEPMDESSIPVYFTLKIPNAEASSFENQLDKLLKKFPTCTKKRSNNKE